MAGVFNSPEIFCFGMASMLMEWSVPISGNMSPEADSWKVNLLMKCDLLLLITSGQSSWFRVLELQVESPGSGWWNLCDVVGFA